MKKLKALSLIIDGKAKSGSFIIQLSSSGFDDESRQELKAGRISGIKSWKLKKSGHMKKLKAKSFIIDGKAESQKQKFYHTVFLLCQHGSQVVLVKICHELI